MKLYVVHLLDGGGWCHYVSCPKSAIVPWLRQYLRLSKLPIVQYRFRLRSGVNWHYSCCEL